RNFGPAHFDVLGSQFTPQTALSLHRDTGEIITAQSVQFVDTNHLIATFDLEDKKRGNYRVHADDAGRTTIALDTFTVTDQPSGAVGLRIFSPDRVRVGAP